MTTPTQMLVAEPNGQFKRTSYVQPVRFMRDGTWITISTTLHSTGSGWAPGAVPATIRLSDGGRGPVATLTATTGQRTQLTFPGWLSPPVVSGDTATYQTSVPGQTLALTVTPEGGITETITRPTGQINAALRAAFAATAIGGAPTPAGAWSAATAGGRAAFKLTAPAVIPLQNPRQPGQIAQSQMVVSVTPDAGPPTCNNNPGSACDPVAGTFTTVEEGSPGTPFWQQAKPAGFGMPIGNDVYQCANCVDRAYFQIPLSQLNGNMVVSAAHVYVNQVYGSDWTCTDKWSSSITWTGPVGSGTTWNTPPKDDGWSASYAGIVPASNPNSKCLNNTYSFSVLTMMQDAVADGWQSWAFRIAGDEAVTPSPAGLTNGPCDGGDNGTLNGVSSTAPGYNCGYMQIEDNPEIITIYDLPPAAPTSPGVQQGSTGVEPMDNPVTPDEGCGTKVPYVNQTSVTLSSDPHPNSAMIDTADPSKSETVESVYTLTDINGNGPLSLTPDSQGPVSNGDPATVKASNLVNDDEYSWYVLSQTDGVPWSADGSTGPVLSATGPSCNFIVDTTTPPVPTLTGVTTSSTGATVTLTVASSEPVSTSCGVPPCYTSGIYQYQYSLNSNQFAPCTTGQGGNTNTTTNTQGCETAAGYSASNPFPTTGYTGPMISTVQDSSPGNEHTTVDLCLDDKNGGTAAGTPVDVSQCNGTSAQNWTRSLSNGLLQVNGMCADPAGNATASGTPIVLAACNASTIGQLWQVWPDGAWENPNSGLCLYASSAAAGTQLSLYACNGSSLQNWSEATATITVPVSQWGTNTIYLKAETAAGVTSSSYSTYSFYVPSTVNTIPGDVTGDGVPDLVATASDGNLYVYPGISGSTRLQPYHLASGATGSSPDGGTTDWNSFIITHRGVASSGLDDDLIAYESSCPTTCIGGAMYRYTDGDGTATAYPGTLPYNDSSHLLPVNDPAGSLWKTAGLSQILSIGNPLQAPNTGPVPPDLLTIENGVLWYYPGNGGGSLSANRSQLGLADGSWGNMTLIAPGYVGPDHQEELWARDNTSGDLFAYKFYNCGSGLVSLSASCTPISAEGSTNQDAIPITFGTTLPQSAYPAIASAGDGNGGANPDALYVYNASTGVIDAITINPNPANDNALLEGGLVQVGTAPTGTTIDQLS